MIQGLWKKLLIAVAVLLVISVSLSGSLWHQLNTTRTWLNDTNNQLSETRTQLNETITQLNALEQEIESFYGDSRQILSDYHKLREQINLRLGIRQNGQLFITPDDPAVSAIVREITVDHPEEELWKGYGHMFRWIIRDIKYSVDSPIPLLPESTNEPLEWKSDFWRLPAETIRGKAGDCEDMAVLLVSMLLNYNQRKYPAWVFGVRTFSSEPRAHVAVAIPIVDNRLAIFDTAGRYYTPFPDLGGFGCQDIPLAIDHWLSHLETNFEQKMSGAQVYMAFSENFYREFSSTQEFVDWTSQFLIQSTAPNNR